MRSDALSYEAACSPESLLLLDLVLVLIPSLEFSYILPPKHYINARLLPNASGLTSVGRGRSDCVYRPNFYSPLGALPE
jgi:hypothetical protein